MHTRLVMITCALYTEFCWSCCLFNAYCYCFCIMVLTHPPRMELLLKNHLSTNNTLSDETNGDFHFSLVSRATVYVSIYHHFVCF